MSHESRTVCNGVRSGTGQDTGNAPGWVCIASTGAEDKYGDRQSDDCEFAWTFSERDAHGVSIGKTLPAFEEEQKTRYEKQDFTPENAVAIPCRQVLGSYIVKFERTEKK